MRYLILFALLALPRIGWHGPEKLPLSPADAEAFLDTLGKAYFEAKFELYPDYATSKGIHRFDDRLATFSPRALSIYRRRLSHIQPALESFIEDSLSLQSWIDYNLLKNDIAYQQFLLDDLKIWQRSPLTYADACINGIYYLLIKPDIEGLDTKLSSRLRAIPKIIASARANLSDPIELHCEIAATKTRDFAQFLGTLNTHPKLKHLDIGLVDKARAALAGFADFCDSLAITADPDFALGRERFGELLSFNQVSESPEEIVAYATQVLEEAKRQRKSIEQAHLTKADSLRARALGRSDIIRHTYAEIESAKVFLTRNNIVSITDTGEVRIVETPRFLKDLIPGYAYEPPGPFDSKQVGYLYIPLPDSLSEDFKLRFVRIMKSRQLAGIIFHEIFPGHHLQFVVANGNRSLIRRMAENTFAIEGWAFYCEEFMARSGYYGDDSIDHALGGIIFRAARAIVDVKLQVGDFSLDDAINFMINETGADRDFIEREVKRYAVHPCQAMSYLVGKRKIMKIRDQVEKIQGGSFDLKRFHDTLLGCGALPLNLLQTCVTSEIMGRR